MLLLALLLAAFPGGAEDRDELVSEMKELQQSLGFPQTGNFKKHSTHVKAYYRCYYTGKLELPAGYDQLELRQGEGECAIDPAKYDIFLYPIEAVASGKAPVTSSLEAASVERLLVVVPHEDFHQEKHVRNAPSEAGEAAATLAGFLAAAEFARTKYGEDSAIYRRLAAEPEIFLRKAEVVNRYYDELARLYAEAAAKRVSKAAALERKGEAFARLERECKAIQPDPASFNKCPGALNNAGLAFDRTYTATYAAAYAVYLANNRDVRATLAALRSGL